MSADGILPALQACREAGVKIICFDSLPTDTEYIETFIANDNYKQGLVVGEEILRNHPEGGALAIINNPLAESVVARERGLLDAIEGSNIEVVETKSISTYDEVLPAAEDILSAHPDLEMFWGLNDDVSLMIYGSVQAAGMTDQVSVYAPDGSPAVKTSIKAGGIIATAAQSPATWGKLCAEACYKLLAGEPLESEYLIDTFVINIDNVDQYGTEGWQ